ncbi:MAG: transposase [Pyrinomonadaceae bacterium]|nr:transposase [Pyrinomonadaceae bacterium]
MLRKKGLYSSHISNWRKQLNSDGNIAAVKRGRRPDDSETKATKALAEENRSLRKEEAKLERRLKRAELMLDIQKKASELLGIPLRSLEDDENDS